jgi:hypothetical protein
MTGWNYPPGVTGREYEIAGPDWERDLHRACGAKNVTVNVVQGDPVQAALDALNSIGPDVPWEDGVKRARLALIGDPVTDVDFDVCPFDAETLVEGFNGMESWTCPLCGTEHNDEPDDWRL